MTAEPTPGYVALMSAVTEEEFMRSVVGIAEARGWLVYHTHDSRRSQRGFPDLTLVRGPRIIFAELKTVTGKLRTAQRHWLAALRDTAAEVYVWRPLDMRLVEETLS